MKPVVKRENNVLHSTMLPSDADSNSDLERTGPSTSELALAAVVTLSDHLVLQR